MADLHDTKINEAPRTRRVSKIQIHEQVFKSLNEIVSDVLLKEPHKVKDISDVVKLIQSAQIAVDR